MFLLTLVHTHSQRLMHFGFIALLILVLRLPSLEEPFDNDSSAVAYSARLITRGEPLYSTHHPGHHLPAVYYTYALAFGLLGDQVASVKLLLIPWLILTAYTIYKLGSTLQDECMGLFAAVIFSVLSSHTYLKGTTAEPEMFAMLPFTASLLLAVQGIQKEVGWSFFWAAGILGAVAFFYKAIFLAPIGVAVGMIVLRLFLERKSAGVIQNGMRNFVGLISGFAIVFMGVVGYFALEGLLGRFWMVFSVGKEYVALTGTQSIFNILLVPIYVLAVNNYVLVVLGFAGAIRMGKSGVIRTEDSLTLQIPKMAVVVWFVLSIATAGVTRVDYPHYSLIVIPSLALLSGFELAFLIQRVDKFSSPRKRTLGWAGLIILFGAILLNSGLTNYVLYSHYIRYRLGIESKEQFLLKGTFEGAIYLREQALADYIVERTTPEEYIYHWTDFPQIYYLADRRAPIDMIWPTQVEITGSYSRIFGEQTRYIIVGSSLYLPEPPWMEEELAKAYQLETVIAGQRVYRRTSH